MAFIPRRVMPAVGVILVICVTAQLVGLPVQSTSGARVAGLRARHPQVTPWLIPFPPKRKRQMAAYSERHYSQRTWRLRHPKVIVEHVSETSSASPVYNTFASDVPDPELHELPNVCSHFVISPTGRIFKLVHLAIRCRHTVGLNWTAIGGNDGLIWPHRDVFNWPHSVRALPDLRRFPEATKRGGERSAIESGAVRADQT